VQALLSAPNPDDPLDNNGTLNFFSFLNSNNTDLLIAVAEHWKTDENGAHARGMYLSNSILELKNLILKKINIFSPRVDSTLCSLDIYSRWASC
jgi:hypothetical protein